MPKSDFTPQHDILLSERLAGKTIEEAAKKADYNYDHAKKLFCGDRFPEFKAKYEYLKKLQEELLLDQAKRSKDALLCELEEIADICNEGETRVSKFGHEYKVRDLTNWIKSVVERAKILGYYVEKKELSGPGGGPIPVNERTSSIDFTKFSPATQQEILEAVEAEDEEAEASES